MRRPLIAGNWKLHNTAAEARELVLGLAPAVAARLDVEVLVCPPFTAIPAVTIALPEGVALGAQNLFWSDSGAYTGEIAAPMLAEFGVRYVIVGHSERRGRFGAADEEFAAELRAQFGETDAVVRLKTLAALRHGLTPIVCCGETLAERKEGQTDAIVAEQLKRGLAGVEPEQAAALVLAYEPVWAIGTGEVCGAEEAGRVCGVLRARLAEQFDAEAAAAIRILYGGSVKAKNAAELLAQPEIDGALVGGASLDAKEFGAIIQAAPRPT